MPTAEGSPTPHGAFRQTEVARRMLATLETRMTATAVSVQATEEVWAGRLGQARLIAEVPSGELRGSGTPAVTRRLDQDLQDFISEVTFERPSFPCEYPCAYGVEFRTRSQPDGSYRSYRLALTSALNRSFLTLRMEEEERSRSTWIVRARVTSIWMPNRTVDRLRLEVIGSSMRVWVHDHPIRDLALPNLEARPGDIGLWASLGDGAYVLRFSQWRVWEIP